MQSPSAVVVDSGSVPHSPARNRSTSLIHLLRRLSVRARLLLLLGVGVGAVVTTAVLSYLTLQLVKIDGPYYQRIMVGQSLQSELVPPTQFVMAPYLVAHELVLEQDPAKTEQLIAHLEELRKDPGGYDDRHAYWSANLPAGPARTSLMDNAHVSATEFFSTIDTDFLPLIRSGKRAEAAKVLTHTLAPIYERHTFAILETLSVAKVDGDAIQAEAKEVEKHRTGLMVGLSLLFVMGALALSFPIVRSVVQPTREVVRVLEAVAAGDLSKRTETTERDELGRMSVALNTTIDAIKASMDQVTEAAERERHTAQDLRTKIDRMLAVLDASARGDQSRRVALQSDDAVGRLAGRLDRFLDEKGASDAALREAAERERQLAADQMAKVQRILEVVQGATRGDLTRDIDVSGTDAIGQVGSGLAAFLADLRHSIAGISGNATALASSASQMTAVSQNMGSIAEETASQAHVVSEASDEVSRNVHSMASSAEEMSSSIREISRNAHQAAKVATDAVTMADRTNQTIAKLGESSAEISEVIKTITSITQQTNLLALNAAIEAARAGDAGKGFAVVANEVKDLAKETAKATEDVERKIDAIQADTQSAVIAIREISTIINEIQDISNTIASAVEQQTATTNEISRSVADAARGTADIAENIAGVAKAAGSTSNGASDTLHASSALARMAVELQALVGKFRY